MNKMIKKCDDLWSKLIRAGGRCERCGKTINLQAAHIISRSHHKTRHMLENGVCLCAGCHIFWSHKEPDQFTDWVRELRGKDVFDRLRLIANGTEKPDYEYRYKILKELDGSINTNKFEELYETTANGGIKNESLPSLQENV